MCSKFLHHSSRNAEIVAVACPQCNLMLEGVVGPRPEVKDIAELMVDALIEDVAGSDS